MGTVTISGNVYTIYGTQADAVIHLTGSITQQATTFLAATADTQARALVSSTRMLERETWASGVDPTAQAEILEATYELAALLVAKPALFAQKTADSNVQSVTAGPTSVTFFKGTTVGKYPVEVMRLIAPFLSSASSGIGGGSESLGDECASSQFDDCDRYSLTRGA